MNAIRACLITLVAAAASVLLDDEHLHELAATDSQRSAYSVALRGRLPTATVAEIVTLGLSTDGRRIGDVRWVVGESEADGLSNEKTLRDLCPLLGHARDSGECEATRKAVESEAWVVQSQRTDTLGCDDVDPAAFADCSSSLRRSVFETVYSAGIWRGRGHGRGDSLSGAGSDDASTGRVVSAVEDVLRRFNISSVLDVGCGDNRYMRHVDLTGVEYIGVDIAQHVIDLADADLLVTRNKARSARYARLDVVEDTLPKGPQLAIVRDVMGHISSDDNKRFLRNLAKAEPNYLMMKTFLRADTNKEPFILARGHLLNLFKKPYCAPDALLLYRDDKADSYMGLWRVVPGPDENVLYTEVDGDREAWLDCQ